MQSRSGSVLAIVVALSGAALQACSHDSRSVAAPSPVAQTRTTAAAARATSATTSTSTAAKPASDATKRAQAEELRRAPFADTRDFASATKGLIAPLPNEGIIKDAKGNVIWDLKAYRDYVKQGQAAPDTVNPSLWRMAQLLTHAGLFEVVPGGTKCVERTSRT